MVVLVNLVALYISLSTFVLPLERLANKLKQNIGVKVCSYRSGIGRASFQKGRECCGNGCALLYILMAARVEVPMTSWADDTWRTPGCTDGDAGMST